MDWNYLYLFLSFAIGFLAGLQGIHNKYRSDFADARFSKFGLMYLFIRGAIPAAAFVVLYAFQLTNYHALLIALGCGTGTELFLRSTFYVKADQKPEGGAQELFFGGFNLLHWLQSYFLDEIRQHLAISRKEFVNSYIPTDVSFLTLCEERVSNNLAAYPDPQMIITVGTAVNKLKQEYMAAAAHNDPKLEQSYRLKLGYLILNLAGKEGFKTLLK